MSRVETVTGNESTATARGRALAEQYDRLQVGSGTNCWDGWCNVDVIDHGAVDLQHDIREPWPFPDDSFRRIRGEHVLEHIEPAVVGEHVLPEVARVLKPGGVATFAVPVGVDARADPTHETEWTWRTPMMFSAAANPWQPGAVYDIGLRLSDRHLNVWAHFGDGYLTSLFTWGYQKVANRWPLMGQDLPGVSGELTFHYRVSDE